MTLTFFKMAIEFIAIVYKGLSKAFKYKGHEISTFKIMLTFI